MPGVTKKGKSAKSYGYDVGGKTKTHNSAERGEHSAGNTLGKLDKENVDRFIERSGSDSKPASIYAKTGYESTSFDKSGNVKSGVKSDVSFLEKDGSWAPAEGRGAGNTGTVMKRGAQSGSITK